MTVVASPSLTRRAPARVARVAIAAGGTALLAVRPALVAGSVHRVTLLAALFASVLVVAVSMPVRARDAARATAGTNVPVLVVGVGAFAVGRLLAGGHAPLGFTVAAVAANTLAAIAEEAWFRRFVYDLLEPGGTVYAVAGTSVLFAAVHVAVYGWWVVPLDLAAGAVLGWQRAVTGSWTVPALTHSIANVFVLW
jgi:hypothetical protein